MTTNYISEDYCSEEIRSLLEENGYMGATNTYLDKDGFRVKEITLQSAMKWLREVHNLYIEMKISKNTFLWGFRVSLSNGSTSYSNANVFSNYEQACEEAIKYCLQNLI